MSTAATTGILVGSWPLGMPAEPAYFYAQLARRVEEAGFDSLFVGDHLFAAGPSVDALVLMADIAARTERISVGSAILQLGLREPVATAKQLATIDMLNGGRLILGVGVGGEFTAEWAAANVATTRRGARVDEYLELAGSLWSGKPVEHHGEFRTVAGVVGSPLPAHPGGPPIWIGGRADAALARAARHDGWVAYAVSPRRIAASIATIRQLRGTLDGFRIALVLWAYVADDAAAAKAGIAQVLGTRYGQEFDHFVDAFCAVGSVEQVAARIHQFRQLGVTDVLLCPQCRGEEFLDQVELLVQARELADNLEGQE